MDSKRGEQRHFLSCGYRICPLTPKISHLLCWKLFCRVVNGSKFSPISRLWILHSPKRKAENGSTPEAPQSAAKKLKAEDAQKLEEVKKKQNKMFYDAKDKLAQLNRAELADLLEYNKQNRAHGEAEVSVTLNNHGHVWRIVVRYNYHTTSCLKERPVKASNFGPHENFELFSRRAYQNVSSKNGKKMQKMEVVEKRLLICKFGSVHFLIHTSSKEANELPRKGSKFP